MKSSSLVSSVSATQLEKSGTGKWSCSPGLRGPGEGLQAFHKEPRGPLGGGPEAGPVLRNIKKTQENWDVTYYGKELVLFDM